VADTGDSFLLGSTYGKYTFRYKIGTGATSEIWKCEELGRGPVAAKFISRHRPFYKEISNYTKGEYDFYKSISHPCLPQAFDVFENSKGYFMIMELFDGPNLLQAFQVHRKEYQPLIPEYIKKMINVLEFVHKNKIIHCDIKPENFLVDLKGNLRLIDFSIMKREKFSLLGSFIKQKIEGTPEYMSPEQIKGKSITYLSDFYSLGLVFYFLYTGKKAFEGDTPEIILSKNLKNTPVDAIHINPNLCCNLMNSIINQLIEKNPQDRIKSLYELLYLFKKTKLANL
jgi:serine/threonine-protein kinase